MNNLVKFSIKRLIISGSLLSRQYHSGHCRLVWLVVRISQIVIFVVHRAFGGGSHVHGHLRVLEEVHAVHFTAASELLLIFRFVVEVVDRSELGGQSRVVMPASLDRRRILSCIS